MAADPLIPAIADNGSLFAIGKMQAHRTGQKHLAISAFRLQPATGCSCSAAPTASITRPASGPIPAARTRIGAKASRLPRNRRLGEELGISLPLTHRAIVEYRARGRPWPDRA